MSIHECVYHAFFLKKESGLFDFFCLLFFKGRKKVVELEGWEVGKDLGGDEGEP